MITPVHVLPLSKPLPGPVKKRRVLLVDGSTAKRDLRAETMRKLGVEVDCAADISEARSWWRADLYNLVLMNVENDLGHRDKFCADVRGATPPQQVAFLVGKPEYLAYSPQTDGAPSIQGDSDPVLLAEARTLPDIVSAGQPQRWGILEASRRISAVRSESHARSRAMREKPAPARDLETRCAKYSEAWSQVLPELQKEEMQ